MNTYKFSFIGRQAGAIGIFYRIRDTYKADSIDIAIDMLYNDYEHIQGLKATENGKDIETKNIKWPNGKYPKRETNPKTGSYLYTRSDTVIN